MDPVKRLAAALMKQNPSMAPEAAHQVAVNMLSPKAPVGSASARWHHTAKNGDMPTRDRLYPRPSDYIDPATNGSQALPSAPPRQTVEEQLKFKEAQYREFGASPEKIKQWLEFDRERFQDFEKRGAEAEKRRARVERFERIQAKAANGEPLSSEESLWMRMVRDGGQPLRGMRSTFTQSEEMSTMKAARKLSSPSVQPIRNPNSITPALPRSDELNYFGGMAGSTLMSDSSETGRLFVPERPAHQMPQAPRVPSNVIQMTPDDERQVFDETGRPVSHYPSVVDGLGRLPEKQITPMRTGVYGHDQAVQDVFSGQQEGTSRFLEQAFERDYGSQLDAFEQNGGAWPEGYFVGREDDQYSTQKGTDYLKILRAMRSKSSDI